MSSVFVFIVLFFCSVALTADVKVIEITAEHFDNYTTNTEGITVVMFYAPWCPHCVEIKPELFKAATKMADINTKNKFVLVNCEDPKNTELCQQQNIEGYPTIKAFGLDNKVHIFNGEPTEAGLLKFVENPEKSAEVQDSQESHESVPDVLLNHTVYLNNDNFNGTLAKMPHALVFFYAPWCPHCQDAKAGVDTASQTLKSKNHAIYAVNCEDKNSKELCTQQEIEGYPTFKYFHNGELYAEYEEESSPEAYLKYLSKPPKEKIKSTPKETTEEETPTGESMENVSELTGETFSQQIKKPNYHTMVMFYAPWCSHCQAAKPVFNSAAKIISETTENRVLAAINCDDKLNTKLCTDEGIDGYPTFVHYSNGKKIKVYDETPLNADKLVKYFSVTKKEEL